MVILGHLAVATAVYITYIHTVSKGQWAIDAELISEYFIVMLGVALPDIDHPKSTIGSRIKWLSYPIWAFFGHRGITHSLLFVGGLFYLSIKLDIMEIKLLSFGAALHLLGDYLTPSGIPIFYPIGKKFRSPITTGSNAIGEFLICFALLSGSLSYTLFFW